MNEDGTNTETQTIRSEEDHRSIHSNKEEVQKRKRTTWETIKVALMIVALLLIMFAVSLNSTVVAPAMSIIATELDAFEQQTWIATAYMVSMNAFQPLSGKFSDIFGRKPILLFGTCFFILGSLVNATTPSIKGLIAGRTLQGFGAGGIMSMVFVIITDIAPVLWRPRLQSMLIVVYGVASVVGPLIGGAFVDYLSWRWDFWINLILVGIALVILSFFFKDTYQAKQESLMEKIKRIDFLGTLFSISFVVCLLLALSWGPLYGWGDAHSIGPFVVCGLSLVALVYVEGYVAKEPLIPAEVMLNPSIVVLYLYMCCLGISFIGTLYFGPILFQAVFGANSSESGIRLIPYMICLMAATIGSGILLPRFPYVKFYIIVGAACNMIGYGLFYTLDETANWGRQAGFLTFCGFAFGLSQQNCLLGVQSVSPREQIAVATSLNNFFMLLASSIGIAIYETLYSTFLASEFKKLPMNILAVANEHHALTNYLFIKDLPADVMGPVIHAYMQSLHNVFIVPIVAGGVGFICSLFIRNVRYGAPAAAGKQTLKDVEEKAELQQQEEEEDTRSARTAMAPENEVVASAKQ